MKGNQELKDVIQYGLNLPGNSEDIQKLWAELLEFYLGLLSNQNGFEIIRPGVEKLHNYFHEAFESKLFQSELVLRRHWKKSSFSFLGAASYRKSFRQEN